jgi:hypothetical protein
MAIQLNWSALGVALSEAVLDYRVNAPLEPSPPLTEADILSAGQQLQAKLPGWTAWVAAHPGAITGAVRFLTALAAMGFPGMTTCASIVNAVPAVLNAGNRYVPDVVGFLEATQPAPVDFGGGDSPHPGWGGRGGD